MRKEDEKWEIEDKGNVDKSPVISRLSSVL